MEPRRSRWLSYTNNTEWMKTEGAMLYQPFLAHSGAMRNDRQK